MTEDGFVPPNPAPRHKPTGICGYPRVTRAKGRRSGCARTEHETAANRPLLLPAAWRFGEVPSTTENRGVPSSNLGLAIAIRPWRWAGFGVAVAIQAAQFLA